MKHIKKILILGFLGAFCLLPPLYGQQKLSIVPAPKQIEFGSGSFSLDGGISVHIYLNDDAEADFLLSQLQKVFRNSLNSEIRSKGRKSDRGILIGIPGKNRKFDRIIQKESMTPDSTLGDQGYLLLIKPDRIILSANTETGVFYGVQSLKQLIRTHRYSRSVPALKIKDWPDLKIRGVMDDISRGPVPTKAYMHQQIRRMAEMKINMLTYYTENVVKTKSHPEFAPPGGSLDIKEWAELADYARKYHIDLVGNFQSFGHFEKILKIPKYSHLGEGGSLLSPAFEGSYKLLRDIYSEMIPAFHSEYFHINSDETFELGKGASREMVDSLGLAAVYAGHIKRIHKIISGMGKKVMMWGDIAMDHPEILNLLPKDIIMDSWVYDALDDYAPYIIPFKKAGFKLLISPGIVNSNKMMPDLEKARKNISGFVAAGKKQGVWGMLVTVWDEGSSAFFSRDWYGVACAADQSWHSNPGDTTYDTRFNRAVYGAANNGFSEAIHELNKLTELRSTEEMNEGVLWEKVIPEKGKKGLMNLQDWGKVKKIALKAKNDLQTYDPVIYPQDVKFLRLTADQYLFLAKSRPAIVQASGWYEQACKIQSRDKIKARALLTAAYRSLSGIYDRQVALKIRNQSLWTIENRVYALDRVTKKYDEQIAALREVRDNVLSAIYTLDKKERIPSPSEVRLDIQETDGWYFRGWLMPKPIPAKTGFRDPGIDYLKNIGGVKAASPGVADEFFYDGTRYRWSRVNTPYFAKVDLDELFRQNKDVVMYAFATIDAPRDETVRALAGSSDGIEVFVNGKSVYKNYVKRNFHRDEDELFLPLHKGRNKLMLRITQDSGDWAFSFRLPDVEVRSHKNRYKIIK